MSDFHQDADASASRPGRRPAIATRAAWTLAAFVVAVVIGLAIWGAGGSGKRAANRSATEGGNASTPVYSGAAPASAPAPVPTGNGSAH